MTLRIPKDGPDELSPEQKKQIEASCERIRDLIIGPASEVGKATAAFHEQTAALARSMMPHGIERLTKDLASSGSFARSACESIAAKNEKFFETIRSIGTVSKIAEQTLQTARAFAKQNDQAIKALVKDTQRAAETVRALDQRRFDQIPVFVERPEVVIGREQLGETRTLRQETERLREQAENQNRQIVVLTKQVNGIRAEASRRARQEAERSWRRLVLAVILTAFASAAATMLATHMLAL